MGCWIYWWKKDECRSEVLFGEIEKYIESHQKSKSDWAYVTDFYKLSIVLMFVQRTFPFINLFTECSLKYITLSEKYQIKTYKKKFL